ncbi:D-alanyl-lipoteichoic acid biosynthesis protein DltD [Lysinibacillus sp. MHQ-1]|nr:D-alanyl-lipoteichoic acid biosynthesis protein DltD [Lysinibacillus sp. MHQ-1]
MNSIFSPNYSMLHAYDLAFNDDMDADLRKQAMERLLEFDTVERDRLLKTMYQYQMSNGKKTSSYWTYGYGSRSLS